MPRKYAQFWKEFGLFIKEGVATDAAQQADLAETAALQDQSRRRRMGFAGRLTSNA